MSFDESGMNDSEAQRDLSERPFGLELLPGEQAEISVSERRNSENNNSLPSDHDLNDSFAKENSDLLDLIDQIIHNMDDQGITTGDPSTAHNDPVYSELFSDDKMPNSRFSVSETREPVLGRIEMLLMKKAYLQKKINFFQKHS